MSQAPRCPAGCEKQAHCPCCSLRTAAAAAAARTTDVARGGSKQRQQFGGGARAGAMALSHHLLLLLLLFVALQARPLHAAPLRAWGADGGHALRRPPAARLDAGVEPLGQPADGNLKSTSAALPQPPAPQPRGHRRGPPTGKYSGEGAKTSSEALKTLQRMLEQLERGQGVAKVRSGSADSPVSAASSTAQSVPVPLPGKNPTGLPVGQSNSASLPASSTHAPTHGTVVPLQRTSSAPLQPGWHHGGESLRT
ncbi:uncharacterized protein LOC135182573 [Pogoniulus pusillus]|uniref:uncharacterized protein LOC135182573 n=1 Tax=Pogoniulus pusillus TaxID=488313 RepID=UPI0030B9778B